MADDENDYEEIGGGSHLLGFMFGNVDNSGDLDVDYLDEDAKEHLASLADKLGSSLTDIDLAVKTTQTPYDNGEQDYDEKAEDAVDYEDIDEEYDGPEVQAATEEDFLLPKRDFLSSDVSVHTMPSSSTVFDDDNYDEDEDLQKNDEASENIIELSVPIASEDLTRSDIGLLSQEEKVEDISLPGDASEAATKSEVLTTTLIESPEAPMQEEHDALGEAFFCNNSTPLPVLYIEDEMVVLRFSEIFGIYEPLKKAEKRELRYPVPKEMYRNMNLSVAIEEDEEAYLKGHLKDACGVGHVPVMSESNSAILHDDGESRKLGGLLETGPDVSDIGHGKKDSCRCSVSLKVDVEPLLPMGCSDPFYQKFCPLDQLDWEDRINWDNSPVLRNSSADRCQISEADADMLESDRVDMEAVPENLMAESDCHSRGHRILLGSSEEMGFSKSRSPAEPQKVYHPQLLRLESKVDQNTPGNVDTRKESILEEMLHGDTVRRFSKLTMQNRDVLEGSWLDSIIWEPRQHVSKPNLIFDLQDEQLLFEISDNTDGKHRWVHASAMILNNSTKGSNSDSLEPHGPGGSSGGRFNISNDKFYASRKSSQQLKSHMKKRTGHGLKVLHSTPALKLQTMKVKLSNKDIANFHRPKALWYPHDNEVVLKQQKKLPTQGPMKIILKSLGGKGCRLHVDADETVLSVKTKASKKLDFKLSEPVKIFYSGKELADDKSLSDQSVRPNSLLHLVRTKVHLLRRAQKLPGENKSLRPPGAFKKKSDLSVKDGHIFLMEYCEERPLILGNIGMGGRLCTYYQKSTPGDQTGSLMRNENNGFGSVLTIDPADKSPFLGDIKPGCSQSSLETNMYRAPIYQHKVSPVDYLLVRSAKGKLSIRRIDRIDIVGQQEPLMEVMSPGSKNVQTYIMNRLLVFMYREFSAAGKGSLRPFIRADELSAQFPSLSEAFLRKRLKHCADLQRGKNGQLLWVMRRNFRIPLEEELRRMVTPENVCAYESMQAGLYRLKRLGITRLTQPSGLLSAMNQLPDEAITLAAASHIERELQITPWNLSINFVACTNQDRGNIERLEITGVGDPSGRGLGFSFVRNTPKAPVSNAVVKKKTAVGKGSTVTGTDADLRRLSMEAAREILLKFNVPEEQISKQTRWHRIAMIRKLSSEQAASDVKVDPTTISKYARGQRMSFMQLQQQTREKCQEIWERQLQSLSVADEENESDSEANSDLDSFAGDLENLLDAEEFEDGEDGNLSKRDSVGVKGLKMRRRHIEAQAEEEIEDEAAEAAELCRMLMDDDEADRKKKKAQAIGEQVVPAPSSHIRLSSEPIDHAKKFSTMGNQDMQTDVLLLSKENAGRDQKEDKSWLVKRNLSGKVKAKKKSDIEQMELLAKKIKILGDGIKIGKEKKSARETFVCGACGQLGHMRTNKQCPKYGEDQEMRADVTELEKTSGKPNGLDLAEPRRTSSKKLIQINATKIAVVDANDDSKSSLKGRTLKVKCATSEKLLEKETPVTSQNSDKLIASDGETGNKSVVKVNKIIFSNKIKPEDMQVESQRPSIVIKPPIEADKDQTRKKIVIKRPKEFTNVDDLSQEGSTTSEYRKTKRIVDLSCFEKRAEQENKHLIDLAGSRKSRDERRWLEQEEKKRLAERQKEERAQRLYEEQTRALEEQERLAAIRRYERVIRREREEEEHQKAIKKKKEKKRHEIRDDYLDDFPPRSNNRRITERTSKRRAVPEMERFSAPYAPSSKRRRIGEVGLSNILESIVEDLKSRQEISYLFLKPVSKKEAPDYLHIIDRPMDLSQIRDRARKMEYKNREEFRNDIWQIAYNAHKYNDGRNPGIPPLADQLLEYCDFLLEQYSSELAEAEAVIRNGDF